MSSGWFWALPDSDSDGEGVYSPVQLQGGQLACYRHLRIICYECCVNYSFMELDSDYDEESDDNDTDDGNDEHSVEGHVGRYNPSRGTGSVIPRRFTLPSPNSTPTGEFKGLAKFTNFSRFVHRQDSSKALIYTDGACINNGQANPKAGWAFVYGPSSPEDPGNYSVRVSAHRLENKGPFGDKGGQTSNRAELRAVIAALRYSHRLEEDFRTLVIATDSEYVVQGATGWVRGWVRNGWRTRNGGEVKNKDLWECLLGEFERAYGGGLKVEFWRIPRELNHIADAAAKAAAAEDEIDNFMDAFGVST